MSKVFQYEKPKNSTGFLLWKVTNTWQKEIKKSLLEFNLTHSQFVVLANSYYLGQDNNNITQKDISEQVGIDKMLISNILKSLLEMNLITREEHQTDTRAKTIKLTKTGLTLLKKTAKIVEDFDHTFFSKLKNSLAFNSELSLLLQN